jgi:hypothetical protein
MEILGWKLAGREAAALLDFPWPKRNIVQRCCRHSTNGLFRVWNGVPSGGLSATKAGVIGWS